MSSATKDKSLEFEENSLDFNQDDEFGASETSEVPAEDSSEFALKMINSVKAMNNGEISHYEMVNNFTLADEQNVCLCL